MSNPIDAFSKPCLIEPLYQPIYDLSVNQVHCYESITVSNVNKIRVKLTLMKKEDNRRFATRMVDDSLFVKRVE